MTNITKIAVINFSGNVGKSMLAKHLFAARLPDAELITVESINADEGDGETVKGSQYGALSEHLMLMDAAIVDIGSSNVEEFTRLMRHYRGSQEDFDLFVIPAVRDGKQIRDTIATIDALAALGVPAKKIVVIFNKLEDGENVEEEFWPLVAYHKDQKKFTYRPKAAVIYSELYQKLRVYQSEIRQLVEDETDYKQQLKSTTDEGERAKLAARISMRRLAFSALENLDEVFKEVLR